MYNLLKKHKDKSPELTIQEIRQILGELEIFTNEIDWYSASNHCHSVRLIDSEIPDGRIGTNGKGVSRIWALASAYGEFMERLQNEMLYTRHFGLMDDDVFYPDEKLLKMQTIIENNHNIFCEFSDDDKEELIKYRAYANSVPYLHLNKNKVEYLPICILRSMTGSTGMCAGNTASEALLQGLCEIFERYALKQIVLHDFATPTIPNSVIKNYNTQKLFNDFSQQGFSFQFKDCSLDDFIPVVAIIIYNDDFSKYRVNIGADPVFEIALERCITEINQGTNALDRAMIPIDLSIPFSNQQKLAEFNNAKHTGTGQILNTFFRNGKNSKKSKIFHNNFINNNESLNFFLQNLMNKGYNIYIRDVSFLNFPAYHIFIPEMSINRKYDNSFIIQRIIKETLLNLNSCSREKLRGCLPFLEFHVGDESLNMDLFKKLFNITIDKSSQLNELEITYILSLICIKLEDYKKAFKYLSIYLKDNHSQFENTRYGMCCLFYLKLKSENYSEDKIRDNIDDIFGNELTNEVISDMKNTDDIFTNLNLPVCGDCISCSIREECYYDRWKQVRNRVKIEMKKNLIDQRHLMNFRVNK